MRLTTPIALLLLFSIPLIWYMGWPRHAFRRRRDITSLILRTVIVLLVVLALSGVQLIQAVDKLAVVFLVDASDSVGQQVLEQQIEYIREAVADKPIEDEWAVVVFGADVSVENSFNSLTDVRNIESSIPTTQTDIARAIDTAISLFPADTTRRIVILSDGQETLGNAESRAQLAAASGIEISYVPFFREPIPDVRITNLDAPSVIGENQQFDINISIEAEEATPATIRVFSEGRLIHEEDVDLTEGTTNYTLTQTSEESGFLDFSAQIDVVGSNDNFGQNNQLSAFSQVVGPPRVLVVASEGSEITNLVPALEEAQINVDIIDPGSLPLQISGLANYKSVILANVPAVDLSNAQMELLDTYVRDIGGGLVVIGGPDAYGPGGYFQTPLERTLPVEMRIRDQQRLPQVTIAYLIDRSGSMGAVGASGVPNIELAKEAIIRSIEFLQPTDRAGVASFDVAGSWLAQIQPVFDRRELQRFVAQLRAGGGTSIMAGMQLVTPDLTIDESERKHIILLTDGGAQSTGLVELTEQLFAESGVTTSVIAIGSGAAPFLDDMAAAGNGNYHVVAEVAQIPTIFAQETVLATRSYILEEEFTPALTANNPIISGVSVTPTLFGYIATTPKTAAQVVLSSGTPFNDPLLATWQYGLGRAVAFTSDATARWASNWVNWDDFSQFWSQTINWTIAEGLTNNLETRVVMEGEQARIIVDARDEKGAFLNNLSLQSSLLSPEGVGDVVNLQQVAPGRYEATFIPEQEGAYFLAVNGLGVLDGATREFNQVNGWVMSYSPEYNATTTDTILLENLAAITGGTILSETPSEAFAHTLEARTATAPIWHWFLILAMLLLPIDIAVRRLIITRSDIQRLREFISRPREMAQSERMSSLLDVRERARQQTGYGQESGTTIGALRSVRESKTEPGDLPSETPPPPSTSPRPTSSPSGQPTTTPQGNIGARLLRTRKEREEDDS